MSKKKVVTVRITKKQGWVRDKVVVVDEQDSNAAADRVMDDVGDQNPNARVSLISVRDEKGK